VNHVQPFLDLFYSVVDRVGVKVAFAGGIEYALCTFLIQGKISEQYGVPAMVIVAVAFFVSRVKESAIKATNGTEPSTNGLK
jgi:hypothetical protein